MSSETPRGPLREATTRSGEFDNRRAVPNPEYSRILADCRDLTAHRLLVSLTSMMDRLADGLLTQANRTNVLAESTLLLESRSVLQSNRAYIVNAFEKALRERIDRRLHGEPEPTAPSLSGEQPLELVDHAQVEEDIAIKNFMQSLSNRCHDELNALNGRIGFLLGQRQLVTEDNPFGPHALGASFRDAWESVDIRREGKVIILKMMDGGMIGDINAVYADINRHLANLNVLPQLSQGSGARLAVADGGSQGTSGSRGVGARASDAAAARNQGPDAAPSGANDGAGAAGSAATDAPGTTGGDLFAMLRDLITRSQRSGRAAQGAPAVAVGSGFPGISAAQLAAFLPLILRTAARPQAGMPNYGPGPASIPDAADGGVFGSGNGARVGGGGFALQLPGTDTVLDGSPELQNLAINASLPVSAPDTDEPLQAMRAVYAAVDPRAIINSLTRLQQSYAGSGTAIAAPAPSTAAAFDPNLLRRLGPAELGSQIDPTGAVTIELVAMLFDFVSSDRYLPDAIKNLLYRLQIPVLKAALLDKDFFTRRTHPARLLVNRYAEAGIAWRVEQGTEDPLFLKIHEGVARIQAEFTDQLELFTRVLTDFESFLANEEESAEQEVQITAEEIARRERQELANIVADAELDRRIKSAQPPEFLVSFLRNQWRRVLINAYLETGEEGAGWRAVLAEMDNLLWSVQPKRKIKDRKDLVTRLPDMLSRLRTRLSDIEWDINAREKFMTELVECHARAVTATMEREAGTSAKPLSGALAATNDGAEAVPVEGPPQDQYHQLAESMARGMWVEFTEESGILVFAKLSWVSPLRGKYLFTHRNGTKAFSLTREDLAQRFRDDTARPVESEPLLDRAFSDVLSRLSAQAGM